MFKKNSSYISLLIIFFIIFLVGLAGIFKPARKVLEKAFIVSIKQKIYDWQRFLKKDLSGCGSKNESEIVQLKAKIASLEEENKQQRRLLSLPLPKNWQFYSAKVIGLGSEVITLNAGAFDGLRIGMPVLVGNIFLGKISEVSEKIAKVKLVTYPEEKYSVSIYAKGEGNVGKGLLIGEGLGEMKIEQILLSEDVSSDDSVLVNIEGGDLLIGNIDQVIENKGEMFKSAKVKRLYNPEQLETVFVIRGRL